MNDNVVRAIALGVIAGVAVMYFGTVRLLLKKNGYM